MDWIFPVFFITAMVWWLAWGFALTPWYKDWRSKRREAKEEAEAKQQGFQDPSTEAIIKVLTTDYEGWEMVSEYEIKHTSGIVIKHPSGEHPSLFSWYYPGYGSPNYFRVKNRYSDKLSYDQRKMLHAIRIWKIHKARELFNAIPKEAHD